MNAMSPRRTGIPDLVAGDKRVVNRSHTIDIQWGIPRDQAFPPDSQLRRWVAAVLDDLAGVPTEICIRVTGSDEIAELNRRYRDKAAPTNVLSFPGGGEDENGVLLLGDLVLCAGVIAAEAAEQGKSLAAHVAHMLVHGILHLEGYDHEDEREASEMERVETTILASFGFADPYTERAADE